MLIRLELENYLSYNQRTEFSLITGDVRQKDKKDHEVELKNMSVLKTAVLYGANASGKSNLIKAVQYIQQCIQLGLQLSVDEKYYRIDKNNKNKPSVFVLEIEKNDVVYEYGFGVILSSTRLVGEWLYKRKKSGDELVFNREIDENGTNHFAFGNLGDAKNRFEIYQEDFVSNTKALFLTEIAKKNFNEDNLEYIAPYKDVTSFIKDDLVIIFPSSKYSAIGEIGQDTDMKKFFEHYLNTFHTGIDGLVSISSEIDNSDLPDEIKQVINQNFNGEGETPQRMLINAPRGEFYSVLKDENNDIIVSKLGLAHTSESGDEVIFELSEESDGTIRLFDFIPALHEMSISDKTYLVDEIDRSMHSLMTKKIIELFIQLSKGRKSQLIATTHEALLLNQDLLRRDEVWFVEKKQHESKLYSLDQFKVRPDKDIHKGYLKGVYGAIPLFKSFGVYE